MTPVPGSIGSRRIFSGCVAATSSMSMPPAALAMITGRRRPRDRRGCSGRARGRSASPSSIRTRPTFLPFGAGLMRDERHPDDLLGELLGLVNRARDLDAAALAAAAGMNLRLDDAHARRRDAARCRRPLPPKTPLRRAAPEHRSARGQTWLDIREFSREKSRGRDDRSQSSSGQTDQAALDRRCRAQSTKKALRASNFVPDRSTSR